MITFFTKMWYGGDKERGEANEADSNGNTANYNGRKRAYNDRPQKTVQLKYALKDHEQMNMLDTDLLKTCVSRIWVSHFYTIEVEFINGVIIKNITERVKEDEQSSKGDSNSGETTDY